MPQMSTHFSDLGSFLNIMQATIAPAMIISGLAFLLSIMAGRYARCIDRTRVLLDTLEGSREALSTKKKRALLYQLRIMYKRCRHLRTMMAFASLSVFLVVFTISAIFLGLIYGLQLEYMAAYSFLFSLGMLILSTGLFFRDIVISLYGIKVEIQEVEAEIVE